MSARVPTDVRSSRSVPDPGIDGPGHVSRACLGNLANCLSGRAGLNTARAVCLGRASAPSTRRSKDTARQTVFFSVDSRERYGSVRSNP